MHTIGAGAFNINYPSYDLNTGLFVRASVYDVSGAPSLLGTVNLSHVASGVYSGSYTASAGVVYLVISLVYTDGTYSTVDTTRAPEVDSYSSTLSSSVSAIEIETGVDLKSILKLVSASLAGKLSGAGTTTITIRDINDTKNRIVATVDASGNRTAITKDVT